MINKKKVYKAVSQGKGESDNVGEQLISMVKDSILTEEEKAVRNRLRRISINARRKAFSKKSAVTIIRNGKILKVKSNRKSRHVGTVKKIEFVVDISKPIKIK